MGAFEDLLKRQGYVKLDHYGLVLTPDDRILSTRPAVLDDGLGGKIVGWADGDLAAAELEHWGAAAKPAAAKRVAANPGLRSTQPMPPAPPRTARGTAPPLPGVTAAAAVTAPAPVPVAPAPIAFVPRATLVAAVIAPVTKSAVVAAEPVVEEDEWEWEIAMARARAVADDVQEAAASIAASFTAPSPRKIAAPKRTMTMPMPITEAAVSRPMPGAGLGSGPLAAGSGPIIAATSSLAAATSATTADPMASWGSTEPLHESWSDSTRESPPAVMSAAAKTLAVVKTAVRVNTPQGVPVEASRRSTVIPVPQLPVAAKGTDVRGFNPGAPPPRLASLAARSARGTQPPSQPTIRGMAALSEDTVVTGAAQAANEDRTSPYVTLPSEVKPTGFAHTKRVAAKHR